jgi:hypothetical protein
MPPEPRGGDRAGERAGGRGRNSQPPLPQRARVERAFTDLKAMLEIACTKSTRQQRVALGYAAGATDEELAAAEGISVQGVRDTMRAATRNLEHAFPRPELLLRDLSLGDLLRVVRNRADPEPNPEFADLEPSEGETTAIHGRPHGMAAADLREPPYLSPGYVALRWHEIICRLRQMTQPERARAREAEVPRPARTRTEERRSTRRERRAERRRQA